MNLIGNLEKKVSKKTGNEYIVLVITFPNGYEKTIFLEEAELYMLTNKGSK